MPCVAQVEALTSVKTQLPYEYYVLPFCHKGINLKAQDALNLGEVLRGTRIYETPYKFDMGQDSVIEPRSRFSYTVCMGAAGRGGLLKRAACCPTFIMALTMLARVALIQCE